VLGFMELLSARTGRVGYFRPIADDEDAPDPQIELIRSRFGLEQPYDAMRGASASEARGASAQGDRDGAERRALASYRRLERECDVVICEGTDVGGSTRVVDLDLNARLANQSGCPVLAVVRGAGPDETTAAVRGALDALAQRGCDVFGAIVSRVDPAMLADVSERIAAEDLPWPVYTIPEHPELNFPTVGEIASALGATRCGGAQDGMQREVRDVQLAAMDVAHFLGGLGDGTLVVVTGDRPDILVGSLLSTVAAHVPAVAGVVLSGEYEIGALVRRLLADAPFPVLEAAAGPERVLAAVRAVQPAFKADNERRIAAALGVFQSSVDAFELEQRLALERPPRMTPAMFEYELVERAREPRQHIVLPEGDDDRILRAADILLRRGIADLTILGDPEHVRARADALGLDVSAARVTDPARSASRAGYAGRYHALRKHKGISEEYAYDTVGDLTYFATMMLDAGEVDGMVSGAVHTTADTIRPAFEVIRPRAGVATVSSVFFMLLADRVLVYGDCAVNPAPDVGQLADIAISSAETALAFGIDPRIAMLSYATGASGRGAAVDAVREATELVRERRPDLKVEGPIQYDAAIDADVARLKLPESAVAGQATVFIFPDLESGNIAYKAVQRSGNARAFGPILQGLRRPMNDLSRGCTVTDIVNTAVITAIQAQEAGGASTSRLRVRLPHA
jgi:phosphate acetyltransferase